MASAESKYSSLVLSVQVREAVSILGSMVFLPLGFKTVLDDGLDFVVGQWIVILLKGASCPGEPVCLFVAGDSTVAWDPLKSYGRRLGKSGEVGSELAHLAVSGVVKALQC